MLLLQNGKKKLFSLTSSILLFKHYILYYLLCLFHYTKIHLLILSINVKWMNNQLFHLMAWSDFSGHKHYQDVIMANYTKKTPKQTNMFIQPKIVFQATRAE